MAWIVLGEENGKVKLVSKARSTEEIPGILPKGSYLTIEDNEAQSKFLLRVDESSQFEPFTPSPLIIEMGLSGLYADETCRNILTAYRVKNISKRTDGKIDFIRPRMVARRSTQEEVNFALGGHEEGPKAVSYTHLDVYKRQAIPLDRRNLWASFSELAFVPGCSKDVYKRQDWCG